ncbi:hypothetical protein FHL15_009868 [Xylaria flabelliformis]|uniref:Fumarate lyase N-terminal domain-containing protein n=1 Tax=Xylaria flabelliformis TaxID=2512241 RepID=A0A553HMX5_9PEZI|nr:hypothetical protein FHL15_009868 [Xylaria flabelliformis]
MASDKKSEANILDPLIYNESIYIDKAAHKHGILGSIAFARAKQNGGILTADEFQKIESGLQAMMKEWDDGSFKIMPGVDEDIHTANERRLGEIIDKEVAGNLHTGRNRNEQVACDMRKWLRGEPRKIETHLATFLQVTAERAGLRRAGGEPVRHRSRHDGNGARFGSRACSGTRWGRWRTGTSWPRHCSEGAMLMLVPHVSRWAEDLIIHLTRRASSASCSPPNIADYTTSPTRACAFRETHHITSPGRVVTLSEQTNRIRTMNELNVRAA